MKYNRQRPDTGYLHERTNYCLVEKAMADYWEQTMNGRSITLGGIIGEPATLRDRYVSASLIQWLGTNVGWSWLTIALGKSGWSLNGNTAWRDKSITADPMLNALHQAQLDQKWKDTHARLSRDAFQETFDYAEPS